MIGPRRFWSEVSVVPESGGFGLRLDDRPLRTPAHGALVVPTRALADAIADEWRAIEDIVRPEALPFTRAANAAIDRVAPAPAPVIERIAAYGDTDLICYRATEPEGLVRRQAAAWDPMLDWAAEALGAPLERIAGLAPRDQPAVSRAALRAAVAEHGAFGLTALHDLVTLSGSLVLGLAVARGACATDDAWARSRTDETWQAEHWGCDAEAEAAAAERHAAFARAARLHEILADSAFVERRGPNRRGAPR